MRQRCVGPTRVPARLPSCVLRTTHPLDARLLPPPLRSHPFGSWAAAAPSPDIALPQRNDYLPTDFSLRCEQAAAAAAADGSAEQQQQQAAAENGAVAQQNGAAAQQQQQEQGQQGQQQAAADGGAVALLPAPDAAIFPSPPALLLDEPGLRAWHKLDASFRQPRAAAYLRLHSAAGYASPRAAAAAHLLIKLLEARAGRAAVAVAGAPGGGGAPRWPAGRQPAHQSCCG